MINWIIKITIISFILIILMHHLYTFFMKNLTIPKVKDLVNKPQQHYDDLYNSIKQQSIKPSSSTILNATTNSNTNSNLNISNDNINMKNELKNYLKELSEKNVNKNLDINTNSSINNNNNNNNNDLMTNENLFSNNNYSNF